MTVPPEVQAMHLRHFDAYIAALVTRLTQTDEHYNFIALCERIERLLSIDQQFYEDQEEPRVVETPLDETRRRVTEEDRNRCRERDQDGNRCLHDEGHQGRHLAAWGLSAGWPDATPEQPEEEPTDERHDEPLRVSLHEVPSEMRGGADSRVDGARDSRIDEEPLLQRASNGGSGQQPEPVAEEPVRAEPTMTPEELASWDEALKRQPKGAAVASSWTPERRQAARDRALNQGLGSKVNKHVAKTPSISGSTPSEAPPATAPSLPDEASGNFLPASAPGESPAGDPLHFVDPLDDDSPLELPDDETDALLRLPTPEEAAHEDAAIIIAELEPKPSLPRGGLTTGTPACECPEGHLKPTELWMALDRAYTHRHAASCPLHRHRHRFGTAPDAEGRLIGRCECGDEEYRPVEPDRALNKKPAAVSA